MNKILSLVVLVSLPVAGAFAQASKYGGVKKAATTKNTKATNTQNKVDSLPKTTTTTAPKTGGGASKYANIGKAGSNPGGGSSEVLAEGVNPGDTIPDISYDTLMPNQLGGKPAITLRNNYGVDKGISSAKERTPLAYEHLRDEDATYSQFVWREINGKEKINQSFMYGGKDEFNRTQTFFSILIDAIQNDSVQAFNPQDDRFTTPLDIGQVLSQTMGKIKTITSTDPVTGKEYKTVTRGIAQVTPDSVYTFRVKEQWIFDRESSRMFVRIIGIAPVAKTVVAGKTVDQVLFWVYYPDLRATLAKYDVYNPKNSYGRMTWEDLFEGRMFNSYIVKSTVDNSRDAYLKSYIPNSLDRLYEGENIKDKIFNYEQNQWAY